MLTVTLPAQQHFYNLLSRQKTLNTAIRIFISDVGTPTARCGVCFCPPTSFSVSDVVCMFGVVPFRIEGNLIPFLKNSVIDVVQDALEIQLTFKAPYAKGFFGNTDPTENRDNNSDIFSLQENIKNVLKYEINPQLSLHGGGVSLVNITKDLVVVLKFSGGCNGCAMATRTMKLGIETTLKRLFPQLKSVQDVTEHQHGDHSYF